MDTQIIPVHADINGPTGHGTVPDIGQQFAQSLRQKNPAALDAQEQDILATLIPLDDLMSHPHQGPLQGRGVHENFLSGHKKTSSSVELAKSRCDWVHGASFTASLDRIKGTSNLVAAGGCLAALSPFGPVLDDPIGQGLLEADIPPCFLGFNPFVFEDFLPLRLKFTVK